MASLGPEDATLMANAVLNKIEEVAQQVYKETITNELEGVVVSRNSNNEYTVRIQRNLYSGILQERSLGIIEKNTKVKIRVPNGQVSQAYISGVVDGTIQTGSGETQYSLSIGTVTSGPTANATITGESPAQKLNLVLPKGDVGPRGEQGEQGETGNGIVGISKTGTDVLMDIYTISFTDGSITTFRVTNGKGIVNIAKTGSEGLVDTYTITFNDASSTTFTVTNGANGVKGDTGATPNITASATTLPAGSSATVTKSGTAENPTFTFGIPKGEQGPQGPRGESGVIYQGTGENTDGAMSQKATTDELDNLSSNIPTKTSQLQNDSGFLTSAPVTQVSGRTGNITTSQLISDMLTGAVNYGDKIVAKSLNRTNGYIQYASGLIINFGYSSSTVATTSITFGKAFPNNVLGVSVTWNKSSGQDAYAPIVYPSKTGMQVFHQGAGARASGQDYIAFGF